MQLTQKLDDLEKEVAEGGTRLNVEFASSEDLDCGEGFYQITVKPMLSVGHEGELYEWLKMMGLIQESMKCINIINNEECSQRMLWKQARVIDKFQWVCNKCKSKRTIRDQSFFKSIKCGFPVAFRIILGWCKGLDQDSIAEILHVKQFIVKKVYESLSNVINCYIKWHLNDFYIGNLGDIVVADLFSFQHNDMSRNNNNYGYTILCIGEVKKIPTKFWYHVLASATNGLKAGYEQIVLNEAAKTIVEVVRPGSTLVINSESLAFVRNILEDSHQYPLIVETNQLSIFDAQTGLSIAENLDTIWKPALEVCQAAHDYTKSTVTSFLRIQQWRHEFASTTSAAFESIMHHIAEMWEKQT